MSSRRSSSSVSARRLGARLLDQHVLLHDGEGGLDRQLDGERRIGMRHLVAAGEEEGAQALLDAAPEAQAALEQHRVLERVDEEGGDDRPPLARDGHQLGDRRPRRSRRSRRRPSGAASASRSTRADQLEEMPLLERPQELVLVAEAGIEAAHRRSGAARDLRDRHRAVALLGDQLLGGVEQPLQRVLAARLLRLADGAGAGRLSTIQNQNPIRVRI